MRLHDTPTAEGDGLTRRLLWMTLLRIAVVSILLGATAAVIFRDEKRIVGVEQALLVFVIACYAASLAYLLVLRTSARWHGLLAYVQICGDVFIAAALVWLTGGAESILVFLFPLSVVTASVLLYRRGAVVAAVLSSAALCVTVGGLSIGRLRPPSASAPQAAIPLPRLVFFLFAHASAIFLSAALASYLAEQLRATRERLTLREHDYLALERLHESIVHSVSSGIMTADRFGRVTFVNHTAESFCGFELRSVRGQPIEQRLPALAGRLRGGTERFEIEHVTDAGERRRLELAVSPLFDRSGRNQGHVVAVQDLTGIRAMEESLKRSEKLAAMGAMAAGLAHELRNPLASMSGSIQLLHEGKSFNEDEQRLMSIVLREADRLNGLVTDFLKFARPPLSQLEPLDLRAIVLSTVTLFRNDPARRGVEVAADLPEELPVMADAGQLNQVLWNLLANAAEAKPQGGTIRVSGSAGPSVALIEIADEGPGISAEDLPHIFEPFYTTKAGGTGLGLAIVHSIVERHGGEVEVRSVDGRGTTFTVRLPARPAQARAG